MNRIKLTSKTTLKLNDVKYKGYDVGSLPPRFGFKYKEDKEGIYQWFNYKGLTWVIDQDHWTKFL